MSSDRLRTVTRSVSVRWSAGERPDLDVGVMAEVARILTVARLLDEGLAATAAAHGSTGARATSSSPCAAPVRPTGCRHRAWPPPRS
jgi:hypothetical protein